jgi:hypothetical protein
VFHAPHPSGARRQTLQRTTRELARDARALQKIASARREAERLQGEADAALVEAESLKLQARLEDLTVWQMKKVKKIRKTCKGSMIYAYGMSSWREGGRTRNVHLGSARKLDREAARRKAREMKAEALGLDLLL